jgi:L-aspartate oxidase
LLVLGGGLAGLSVALRTADSGFAVTILAKRELTEGSSLYAQGGIAAVMADEDSMASHTEDTMVAGAGLCNRDAVEFVTSRSRAAIEWLLDNNVEFTRQDGSDELHLTKEGGHSNRRIVHAGDATGSAVVLTLEEKVRSHPDISIRDNCIAIDLIATRKFSRSGDNRVIGVYALNRDTGEVETLTASAVVMATGGASKVYLYTSNPDTSTGDGIAMAWRAGCRVSTARYCCARD